MTTSALVELCGETFHAVLDRGATLVWWSAGSSGPCRAYRSIYDAATARHPDILFASVDTDREPALAAALGIHEIPTLMVFLDRVLVFTHTGFHVAESLDALIHAVLHVGTRSMMPSAHGA